MGYYNLNSNRMLKNSTRLSLQSTTTILEKYKSLWIILKNHISREISSRFMSMSVEENFCLTKDSLSIVAKSWLRSNKMRFVSGKLYRFNLAMLINN